MYTDNERLKIVTTIGITEEVREILKKEKLRLLVEEKRSLSITKILCNLALEKYGNLL